MRSLFIAVTIATLISPLTAQVDTDGDGLFDLVDHPRFDPNASGEADYFRGIQDLDGVSELTELDRLDLVDNFVMSIERGDFAGLNNLKSLILFNNRVASIEIGSFLGLTNLTSLDLGGNFIASLERGDFEGLTNLESLSLSGNRISSIETGDFDGLASLRHLELWFNRITSIENGEFDGLSNLKSLDLSYNGITNGDFASMTNLETLQLNLNRITRIDSVDFEGTNLQGLGLARNQITSINHGDFDGATDLRWIHLFDNQITGIERDAFEGLVNLEWLDLSDNLIATIENGVFTEQAMLGTLKLSGNEFSMLNLTRATFENLTSCGVDFDFSLSGFCLLQDSIGVTGLVLDDATLSSGSFDAVVSEVDSIIDASIVGMTFSNDNPSDLNTLLSIETLDHVTVDQSLFDLYLDEFSDFAALGRNTVKVVPGLCDVDRNGTCDASDIDAMTQNVMGGIDTAEQRTVLIEHEMPRGFHTYVGDSNLDGQFDEQDIIDGFIAGKYLTGERASWAEGDWDGNFMFDEGDFVAAFVAGGYLRRQRAAAVPEPSSIVTLTLGVLLLVRLRLIRTSSPIANAGVCRSERCHDSASQPKGRVAL